MVNHVYSYFCYLFRPNSKLIVATMSAKDFVEQQLQAHKVVVLSKTFCPYCTQAKVCACVCVCVCATVERVQKALDKFTKDYTVIELELRDDMDAVQDYLNKKTGARSV